MGFGRNSFNRTTFDEDGAVAPGATLDGVCRLALVGLGVRELSMASPLVPEVKEALRSVTLTDAAAAAARALDARDAADARSLGAALL